MFLTVRKIKILGKRLCYLTCLISHNNQPLHEICFWSSILKDARWILFLCKTEMKLQITEKWHITKKKGQYNEMKISLRSTISICEHFPHEVYLIQRRSMYSSILYLEKLHIVITHKKWSYPCAQTSLTPLKSCL